MTNPYSSVEEARKAIPIASFITSKSPDGALLSMNIFIKPEKLDEYIKIVTPVVHKIRSFPECELCEISVNPEDKGHIRIMHCWTKNSAWIQENMEASPWFGEYIQAIVPLRDTNRARVIEHFDRIII